MRNRIAIEVKSYRKLQSKWNFMNSLNDFPHLLPKLIEQPSPTRSGGPWKLYWKAGDRNREATTDREGRTEGVGGRQQAKPTGESTTRRTTAAAAEAAAMTWQGAATQLTGKLELYILAGTAPPPPLCTTPSACLCGPPPTYCQCK